MMMQIKTYGVKRNGEPTSAQSPDIRHTIEQILTRGYGVIEGALPLADIQELNVRLDTIYHQQCEEAGGEHNLLAINDADIVRSPLAYDDEFMHLSTHPIITSVAKALLGENVVLLMQNGIINRPDREQFQTRWHRDLNYQHWVSSKPLAMSALVALEDFTDQTGGTVFLPASHKFPDFPSDQLVEQQEMLAPAKAGSIIFFDAMTYHRAGVNKSNVIRRGVNHVIGAPILAPQVDYPAMLNRQAPTDSWQAAYFGYRWSPMTSVSGWRRARVENLKAFSTADAATRRA